MEKNTSFRLLSFLVLGMGFYGFIGIMVVRAQAITNLTGANNSYFQVETPTAPALTPATPSLLTATPSAIPPTEILQPFVAFTPGLYAFIQAPNGHVSSPYVILTAFSSLPQPLTIRGIVNSRDFICTQSPCVITLQSSARFVFRAFDDSGDASDEVIATVNVTQDQSGYLVTINLVSQFTTFNDSCSLAWGVRDESNATWDSFVQSPYEINTKKTLHMLATELILNGIVDANSCPLGGLGLGLNWPTTCGLERATPKMIEWQNQYDEYIWLASKDHGIPPKILKTLIEIESQFWPGNSRFYLEEYGLGQINQLGVDVLLRKDPEFYRKVCAGVLSNCSTPYLSLEAPQQALIRGAAVRLADASCAACPNGLDLNKAKESVSLIVMLLKANCQQVDVILNLAASDFADSDADAATATAAVATAISSGVIYSEYRYEDLWRFTLAAYHSGLSCFQESVNATKKAHLPVTWENLANKFGCRGGVDYVDGFIGNLNSFDFYLYQPSEGAFLYTAPTFVPTRTPIPTPTVFASNAQVIVHVFVDRNANGSRDADEGINAMTVLLTTSTNEQVSMRTQNGTAIFDMSAFTPGIGITVSLPGLYRSESLLLPEQGVVTITFMFDLPALPTNLP